MLSLGPDVPFFSIYKTQVDEENADDDAELEDRKSE